ncbi:MAG: GAF domain-containing sensor histidine kinase [Hyphomicrobiales bacterium]
MLEHDLHEMASIFFEPIVSKNDIDVMGLTYVQQTGLGAGSCDTVASPTANLNPSEVDEISNAIASLLETEGALPAETEIAARPVFLLPLNARFESSIGAVWYSRESRLPDAAEMALSSFAELAARFIESEKKSRFHEVFLDALRRVDPREFLSLIRTVIKSGVFADDVVVWRLEGDNLISIDPKRIDLPRANSFVGQSITEDRTIVIDDFQQYTGPLFSSDFISNNSIRAAISVPIRNRRPFSKNTMVGVCGVFYKRPHGATNIDRTLVEYVVNYYELVWSLLNEVDSLRELEDNEEENQKFLKNAIRCMVDFHDLIPIQSALTASIEDIYTYAKPHSIIEEHAVESMDSLRKLDRILREHTNTIRAAERYSEWLIDETVQPTSVHIPTLVNEELQGIRKVAEDNRSKLRIRFTDLDGQIKIVRPHLLHVVRNLCQNAVRAVSDRQTGGGLVDVNIVRRSDGYLLVRVKDNGAGIEPGKERLIFEPLFTTNESRGGQGLGLSVVREVARHYDQDVTLETRWGSFAEFSVMIRYYH